MPILLTYNPKAMTTPRHLTGVGSRLLLIVVCSLLLAALLPWPVWAASAQPELRIRQLNITGDEFVVLQNAGTAEAQLAEYWLGYANDDTATSIVPTQQLPAVQLEPGQAIMLHSGSLSTCDASVVDELDFGSFANSKGQLALRHLTNTGAVSTFTTIDQVSWGDLATDQIQIDDEDQLPDGAHPVWYRDVTDDTAVWRLGDLVDCSLTLVPLPSDSPTLPPTVIVWTQSATSPPSIYIGAVSKTSGKQFTTPASNRGLKAPQLSEILPNPATPQTDADDEFIELYNPNDKPFDLSNFMLQTASVTSSRTDMYRFPVGTKLAPHSFRAFKSADTNLGLNNSGGQVWLVDPLGTTLDTSDAYGKAKDNQAWIDASGKWQWTTMPTAGTTNKVAIPPINGSDTEKTATVNGKKVTAVNDGNQTGAVAGAETTSAEAPAGALSIHPLTLAVIILAALLYGAYEYRHDLALRYRQFRRNRAAGR